MGKANRERRRAKERRRKQRQRHQRPGGDDPFGDLFGQWRMPAPETPAEQADQLLAEAMNAWIRGDEETVRRCTARLAEGSSTWRKVVDRLLLLGLSNAVTQAWRNGWQPAEVVRHFGRELGKREAAMATDAIAAEMRGYAPATVDGRWAAQLEAIDARLWWEPDDRYPGAWCEREKADREALIHCAVVVGACLHSLPPLEELCPRPGTARVFAPGRLAADEVDEKVLRKVRALLGKAESTEFPEEAEALTTRAQELITRHSIDAALLHTNHETKQEPIGRRLFVDAPYEPPKVLLLQVIAEANRCRTVWHKTLGLSTIVGFPADVRAAELLFTSLLVQATTAMVQRGSRQDRHGRSRTRSFRQTFLASFTDRIGERLRGAVDDAVSQAAADTGRSDLLPVLAERDAQVDRAVESIFGHLTQHSVSRGWDTEGWAEGRAAADRASLTAYAEVPRTSSH
ncbi:MAG TPA: DUF2786 domain-containing protein [Streptosporangiaceae bacterium]|nr:DUF2786 domain-containing protein [Streptosporangiaceae bacterium]